MPDPHLLNSVVHIVATTLLRSLSTARLLLLPRFERIQHLGGVVDQVVGPFEGG